MRDELDKCCSSENISYEFYFRFSDHCERYDSATGGETCHSASASNMVERLAKMKRGEPVREQ